MIFSAIPIYWILAWAAFVTIFYRIRYKDVDFLKSPWGMGIIFAINLFFFAWGILFFLITEFIRSKSKK